MADNNETPNSSGSEITESVQKLRIRKNRCGAAKRRARQARLLSQEAPTGKPGSQGGPTEPPSNTVVAAEVPPSRAPGQGHSLAGSSHTTANLGPPQGNPSVGAVGGGSKGDQARKRSRKPDGTPPNLTQKSKRAKNTAGFPAVEEALRTCIVPQGFPERHLSEQQVNTIKSEVGKALMGEQLTEAAQIPQFQGFRLRGGVLQVACSNAESRNWLARTIPGIQIADTPLQVIAEKDLPRFRRAAIWVEDITSDPDWIKGLLRKQNPGLATLRWQLLGSERVGFKGTRLIVGLWDNHLEAMRALDFKPYYLLGRATVTLLDRQRVDRETAPQEAGPSNG